MMSNANYETQKDEVELLKNILFEQITFLVELPKFIIIISIIPDSVEDPKLNFTLKFVLPEDYPNSSPIYEVIDLSNYLASSKIKILLEEIKIFVEENMSMPMMYQIYEMVKDFVNNQEETMQQEQQDKIIVEEEKLRKYNEKIMSMDKNLIETRTFTPVTKESFEIWYKKFYADSNKGKEKKLEQEARLSGREYFMNLKNLKPGEGLGEESEDEDETTNNNTNQKDVIFDAEAFGDDLNDIDFDQDYVDDI